MNRPPLSLSRLLLLRHMPIVQHSRIFALDSHAPRELRSPDRIQACRFDFGKLAALKHAHEWQRKDRSVLAVNSYGACICHENLGLYAQLQVLDRRLVWSVSALDMAEPASVVWGGRRSSCGRDGDWPMAGSMRERRFGQALRDRTRSPE